MEIAFVGFVALFVGWLWYWRREAARFVERQDDVELEFQAWKNYLRKLKKCKASNRFLIDEAIGEWRLLLPLCQLADKRYMEICNPDLPSEQKTEVFVYDVLLELHSTPV